MASRVSFSQYRLEAEIERHRAECQWDKIPALIDQLLAARTHEDGEGIRAAQGGFLRTHCTAYLVTSWLYT